VSEVANHFHEAVHAKLDAEHQGQLRAPAGTGDANEPRRALLLVDRAVREWAAQAAAYGQSGRKTSYERLARLTPEQGHAVQEAAIAEQEGGLDAERELIAQMVWGIGERLAGIDMEASLADSQHSLSHMAVEAAEILIAAGRVLTDSGWVLTQADEILRDLASAPR
jgi:hypothetical protein